MRNLPISMIVSGLVIIAPMTAGAVKIRPKSVSVQEARYAEVDHPIPNTHKKMNDLKHLVETAKNTDKNLHNPKKDSHNNGERVQRRFVPSRELVADLQKFASKFLGTDSKLNPDLSLKASLAKFDEQRMLDLALAAIKAVQSQGIKLTPKDRTLLGGYVIRQASDVGLDLVSKGKEFNSLLMAFPKQIQEMFEHAAKKNGSLAGKLDEYVTAEGEPIITFPGNSSPLLEASQELHTATHGLTRKEASKMQTR